MDKPPAHRDESALDLSIFADYPTSSSAISHNSSILIELPISSINIPGSDKIPFYLEPSGQLVLANFIYERVNDGIVLKQVAGSPTSNPEDNIEIQDFTTFEPTDFPDTLTSAESSNADDGEDQNFLKLKVKNILSKPFSIPDANGDVVVGGYNISKLVRTAERLKNYRFRRNLSQAKLSGLICRSTADELKFSQTFVCRFENLDVTLRVALRANPYLEKWLDRVENQGGDQEEGGALDRVQDSVVIGNSSPHHPASSSPMETPTTDGLMTELLDLRERISPPPPPFTNGNKESSCDNHDNLEEEENDRESCQLPRRRNRKERVYFTEAAVAQMTEHFALNPWPRGQELTDLAESLGYGRESVRLWFVNRRYQLKLASKQ